LFEQAKKKDIGLIVRVPLASGLLTGKFSNDSTFTAGDHRQFNRNGEHFDKGETFSGINYSLGLEAVDALKTVFPTQSSLALVALKWILMFEEVSTIIPGASRPEQAIANLEAINLPDLTTDELAKVKAIYEQYIKPQVHQLW
jgi:aryl-alcohol dehydrogenase-like predicted oxidoreductase